MTETEKRNKIKVLIEEIITFNVKEKRESQIFIELNRLSPDSLWSNYIFWSEDYFDENDNFLMENFLDKIFSYKPIIL